MPTVIDQVRDDLLSFDRSVVVYAKRFNELLDQYPDEWVGLHEGKVIFHGPDHKQALKAADVRKDINRNRIFIEFVSASPVAMIL